MKQTKKTLVLLSALLIAANSFARGGPADTASPPTPPASAGVGKTLGTGSTLPKVEAAAEADEKDINPFTGQSLSEAQLRRALEREKLITAIASEKTKQTQSNSELQMAKLRNAAEKSRLYTETKVFTPLPVNTAPASPRVRTISPVPIRPEHQPPTTPWTEAPSASLTRGASISSGTRAEIRFADELIELKSGTANNPSIVVSVDSQRTPEQNQPRAINPIAFGPAGLPATQNLPSSSPIVPSPLSPSLQR